MSRLAGSFKKYTILQIRVLNSAIEICKEGITKRIYARTNGEVDILVPASLCKSYFVGKVDPYKNFIFRDGELQSGSSIYSSGDIEVKPVFTYRENVLPNNITHISILRFG